MNKWFPALMLIVGAAMFGIPLLVAAMDNEWNWLLLPVVIVGLVLIMGSVAEGT